MHVDLLFNPEDGNSVLWNTMYSANRGTIHSDPPKSARRNQEVDKIDESDEEQGEEVNATELLSDAANNLIESLQSELGIKLYKYAYIYIYIHIYRSIFICYSYA